MKCKKLNNFYFNNAENFCRKIFLKISNIEHQRIIFDLTLEKSREIILFFDNK
jgi:hypothetical protein